MTAVTALELDIDPQLPYAEGWKGGLMANIVIKSDSKGDTIDVSYYCSDFCAKHDKDYNGWYGCVEVSEEMKPVFCLTCQKEVH